MHLYVNPSISQQDLERVARDLGIQLYDFADLGERVRGRNAGRHQFKFMLRPNGHERYRVVRDDPYTASGERRVWAVCWHGHRDFMRAVFTLDPSATFKTSVDTWDGSEDFEDRHEWSGDRNIGSMAYPQSYADACHC